jgi:capsule polysaccharide export protein KpsE/RkpR
LTPQAYTEILSSREVRLAVVRDTFYFAGEDRTTTFVDYIDRPPGLVGVILKYTIGLPGTIMKAIQGETQTPIATQGGGRAYPTEAEEQAIKAVEGLISSSVDQETGLMSVSVTAGEARLAAGLTESFLQHLTDRVSAIRTEKARRNLAFMEERFAEVEQELRAAEEELATFVDRNSGIQSARLETERERLQRQVSFKSELYQQLQAQVTQARIELQRSEPVITVVEEPVPPMERSAPNRTLIVLVCLILGGFLGLGAAFVGAFFDKAGTDTEGRVKLERIRASLFPDKLRDYIHPPVR